MKNFLVRFSLFCFTLFLFFNLYSDNEKGKLYFEGTKVILAATMDKQAQFLGTVDKIIDSELFAARILPFLGNKEKNELKEKISKCQNQNCIIESAGNMGVILLVKSEISFFSDSFKGTLTLIDVAKNIILSEVNSSSPIEKPEEIYAQMVKELIAKSQYYFSLKRYSKSLDNIDGYVASQFNPVVNFAAFETTFNVSSQKSPTQTKLSVPEQMSEFHDLNNEKNKELIDAYEQALRADRLGETNPQSALDSWRKVASLASEGVIKDFSIKRGNEWFFYNKEIKEDALFKQNITSEAEQQFFPDRIIHLWQEFLKTKPNEDRTAYAEKRISLYSGKAEAIRQYVEQRKNLFNDAKNFYSKNSRTMELGLIKIDKKIDMLLKFVETYGVVDTDFYFISGMIEKIPAAKDKELASHSIFNKWTAQFFNEKCQNRDYQSCITSEQIYRRIQLNEESKKIQQDGCNIGILELCALSAQLKLDTPFDLTLEPLAEKSCIMGSGRACLVLANFYDFAVGKTPKVKKDILYKVSCERGFEPACEGNTKLEAVQKIETVAQAANVKPDEESKKQKTEKEKKKKAEKAEKTEKTEIQFFKEHPYFWYGLSAGVSGVVLGIVSIYSGTSANEKYSDYNSKVKYLQTVYNVSNEWKQNYVKNINKILDDGDKQKKIAIGTGIVGGALIVAGSVLMAIKKPANQNVQISIVPSTDGFFAGATFSY